ncbi:MAG: hypothetical protein RL557_146 [archaeon]
MMLGMFISLISVNAVSAGNLCKGSDGYWRACSTTAVGSTTSTAFTYGNNYNHHYAVKPSYSKYYTVNYDMDYSTEYKQGYFGYDSFRYYPNGYDHAYNYGSYGSEETHYSSTYEVKQGLRH